MLHPDLQHALQHISILTQAVMAMMDMKASSLPKNKLWHGFMDFQKEISQHLM